MFINDGSKNLALTKELALPRSSYSMKYPRDYMPIQLHLMRVHINKLIHTTDQATCIRRVLQRRIINIVHL